METEKKDLVQTNGNAIGQAMDLGAGSDLSVSDCPLGRLSILQSTSDLVKSDQGKQGTIVNVADPSTVLGDKLSPVEVIIFGVHKYWVTTDPATLEFVRKQKAVNKNELPYEVEENGRKLKNTYTLAYFVVLPKEIKEGFALPMEMAFRSSSLKIGEQLAMQVMKMRSKNIPSWAKVFSLGINPEMGKKGKNSWYLPTVKFLRDATAEEIQVASDYYKQFNNFVGQSMNNAEREEEVGTAEIIQDGPQQF